VIFEIDFCSSSASISNENDQYHDQAQTPLSVLARHLLIMSLFPPFLKLFGRRKGFSQNDIQLSDLSARKPECQADFGFSWQVSRARFFDSPDAFCSFESLDSITRIFSSMVIRS
jgi:hypothetical protein